KRSPAKLVSLGIFVSDFPILAILATGVPGKPDFGLLGWNFGDIGNSQNAPPPPPPKPPPENPPPPPPLHPDPLELARGAETNVELAVWVIDPRLLMKKNVVNGWPP